MVKYIVIYSRKVEVDAESVSEAEEMASEFIHEYANSLGLNILESFNTFVEKV